MVWQIICVQAKNDDAAAQLCSTERRSPSLPRRAFRAPQRERIRFATELVVSSPEEVSLRSVLNKMGN